MLGLSRLAPPQITSYRKPAQATDGLPKPVTCATGFVSKDKITLLALHHEIPHGGSISSKQTIFRGS